MGGGELAEPHFDLRFRFHGNFDKFDKFGIPYLP